MAKPIEVDYENMNPEDSDRVLREHGYDPGLVSKYYALVAENAILKQERDAALEREKVYRAALMKAAGLGYCSWCKAELGNNHASDCLLMRALGISNEPLPHLTRE